MTLPNPDTIQTWANYILPIAVGVLGGLWRKAAAQKTALTQAVSGFMTWIETLPEPHKSQAKALFSKVLTSFGLPQSLIDTILADVRAVLDTNVTTNPTTPAAKAAELVQAEVARVSSDDTKKKSGSVAN